MFKLPHDILLPDNFILNTIAGISYIRKPEEKSKLQYLHYLEDKVKTLPTVYEEFDTCYVYLTFSLKCNLSCVYCVQHTAKLNDHLMSEDEIYNQYCTIINKLKNNYSKIEVILYGGEPLLLKNYSLVEKMLLYLENEKIPLRIITNGVLLNVYIDMLRKYPYLQEITITIDGSKDIHDSRRKLSNGKGTYNIIIDNLILALNHLSTSITIRVNLDQQNISMQDEFISSMISIQTESKSKLSICYYRTTNKTNSYNDKYLLNIATFSKFMDQIIYKYGNNIKIKSGDNVYNQMKDILENDYLIYPGSVKNFV